MQSVTQAGIVHTKYALILVARAKLYQRVQMRRGHGRSGAWAISIIFGCGLRGIVAANVGVGFGPLILSQLDGAAS